MRWVFTTQFMIHDASCLQLGGMKKNSGMLYLNCVEKTEKHGDLTRKFPCIPTGISSGFRRKIPGEVVG